MVLASMDILTNRLSGRACATACHLVRRRRRDCSSWPPRRSRRRWTVKAETTAGTGTRLTVQETTMPTLPPPPPLIAQKRPSPMAALSRSLPSASTTSASTTLSAARPYLRIIGPNPPPLRCPPTQTVGQIPAGNPSRPPLPSATA
ncbi:Os02g0235802 [Oryza sativa Japonica Group]|uniref:Os02g0235802 protein n=1 Tax=Oryza sativa subsp. japonica TaxID=39947 RepID=A0A0P0VGT9_ORYSJ|nr:hypothetical protein EE612_010003 [Oryza sativa]BAS77819.1 Os02g0235802 [Oryza sativa Japonica Group]